MKTMKFLFFSKLLNYISSFLIIWNVLSTFSSKSAWQKLFLSLHLTFCLWTILNEMSGLTPTLWKHVYILLKRCTCVLSLKLWWFSRSLMLCTPAASLYPVRAKQRRATRTSGELPQSEIVYSMLFSWFYTYNVSHFFLKLQPKVLWSWPESI